MARGLRGLFSRILPGAVRGAMTPFVDMPALENDLQSAAYDVLEDEHHPLYGGPAYDLAGEYVANRFGDVDYADWVEPTKRSPLLRQNLAENYFNTNYPYDPEFREMIDAEAPIKPRKPRRSSELVRETVDAEAPLVPPKKRRSSELVRETVDAEAPLVTRWQNTDRLFKKAQERKRR
ncbi:MAG: hypothetical protein J5974_06440 [Pyramidobacter sp.]|nr:hypothetical protein [Pyramidobacter sp.]